MGDELNVAFVQDALPYLGGAEKVLAAAHEVFPHAPIYTALYNRAAFRGTVFEQTKVIPSFVDRLPETHTHHRLYLPLYPLALRQFDLSRYDAVLSFSYAVAHTVPTAPNQLHISYMHTPLRYAWDASLMAQSFPALRRLPALAYKLVLGLFRRWDRSMALRTDAFLANSRWVAHKIWKAYGRESEVLYPPVETKRFPAHLPREEYYVALSRLVGHKRMEVVVDAFSRLGYRLLVIGDGREKAALQARASANIHFLGWQPEDRVAAFLGRAKALVHAGEEDFGIAMAEAQAAGCPVIAPNRGGAPEIVFHGLSGLLFEDQTAECLFGALKQFEKQGVAWSPQEICVSAQRFSRENFKIGLEKWVREKWAVHEGALALKLSPA